MVSQYRAKLHPLHPHAGEGSLLPFLGHQQQGLLTTLAERGVTTTVSPLHYMSHNRELALFSTADPPLGLALDPMTYRRQLPAAERGHAYKAQAHGDGPAFDPDRDRLTQMERTALAIDPIELQRTHGATMLITTHHLCGPVGSRGRTLDLELARLSIDHFAAERMDQPPEHAAVRTAREIYAGLAVNEDVLRSPAMLLRLVDAYAQLDAAGFWVRLAGFTHSASGAILRGGGQFLGALSEFGRPVVCSGAGSLHLPLLVADISSSIGLGEAESFSVPRSSSRRHAGPRGRLIYHPTYARSFRAGRDPARRAFHTSQCRCREHPPSQAPHGIAIDKHNLSVRTTEAHEARAGSVAERREWLRAVTAMASHFAVDANVRHLSTATVDTMLAGIDDGRQQRTDEQSETG